MKITFLKVLMLIMMFSGIWVLSENVARVNSESKQVILIDPGHGGQDSGVVGIGKIKEKDINLEIAKKLAKILKKEGFQIIMTREEDRGLYDDKSSNKKIQDMQRRVLLIKEHHPAVTISIHQNSYPDSSVFGPQVFYYQDSTEGAKLAKHIQDNMNTQLKIERPRVEKGNTHYYLLKKSEGVLNIVECAFLTNETEAQKIQTPEYQEKVAHAIAQGIIKYLKSKK